MQLELTQPTLVPPDQSPHSSDLRVDTSCLWCSIYFEWLFDVEPGKFIWWSLAIFQAAAAKGGGLSF